MDSIKFLLSIICRLSEIILGIIFFYLILAYFDIEVIGLYGAIFSFLMTFSFIMKLGFTIAHLKFFSEAQNLEEEAMCNGTFLMYTLIECVIYIATLLILIHWIQINMKNLYIVYILFLANLFSLSIYFFSAIFYSQKLIIKMSLPIIISSLLRIFLLIYLANLFKADIWLLASITLITNLFLFFINIYFLKDVKFKPPTLEYGKKYIKYSLPFFLIVGLSTTVNYIDVLMVYAWFPIAEVGNYFVAKQIYGFVLMVIYTVSNILISTLVKNINSNNNEENLIIIRKTHHFLNLFIIPLTFLIALYSTEILVFIFGESYRLIGYILSILIFHVMLLGNYIGIETELKALGEVYFLAKISIIKTIIMIILMIIFIFPVFLNLGSIGGALAIVLAEVISQLIIRPIIFKKFNLGFSWGFFRNFTIMLGIYFLQLIINKIYSYPIYIIPFFIIFNMVIYLLINYLAKGISKEDYKFILKIINIKNIKESIYHEFKEIN